MKSRRFLVALSGITFFAFVVYLTIYKLDNIQNMVHVFSVKEVFAVKGASSDVTPAQIPFSSSTSTIRSNTNRTTTSATESSTMISPFSNSSTLISTTPKMLFLTTYFKGRMGNRMFEYATLVGLARANGREPFMSSGEELESLFHLSHIRKDIKIDKWAVMEESAHAKFDSKFMKLPPQNLIIDGYMQSWRYFQHAHDEIRREFTLRAEVQKKVQTILATYRNRRQNHVLVAVHVRRGDLLTPGLVRFGFAVAGASYYVNAIAKMRSLLTNQNITFLVGSDDLGWCRKNLNDTGVDFLPKGSPADHFAILSSCDHAIITSGTYGWWIAWLANGATIYYKNFVTNGTKLAAGFTEQDYYPLGWIGLEN